MGRLLLPDRGRGRSWRRLYGSAVARSAICQRAAGLVPGGSGGGRRGQTARLGALGEHDSRSSQRGGSYQELSGEGKYRVIVV